jgi:hypothetical protein
MSTTEIGTTQVPAPPPAAEPRWAPRQVIMLSLAVFLLLGAAGSAAIAYQLDSFDDDRREGDFLTTDTRHLETNGHALTIEEIDLEGLEGDWVLGEARLRATSADPDASVFIGIADEDDVRNYLRGVQHSTVDDVDDPEANYVEHDGGAPTTDPDELDIWVARTSGTGTQSVDWTPKDGDWTAVIMNTGGAAGVDVQADVGATVPLLERFTGGLWITGGVFALAGVVLLMGGLVRTKRR